MTSTDRVDSEQRTAQLSKRFGATRALTEELASPLSPEDQQVQSMPDVSPTKWHRAHTTWFFETFLLAAHLADYETHDPAFGYLYNSYYEAIGARHPRPERGLVARPGVAEIAAYRRHVDDAMGQLLGAPLSEPVADLVELGINHEQQHQELLLSDIKHVLAQSPWSPAYRPVTHEPAGPPRPVGWVTHEGGMVEIGHRGGPYGVGENPSEAFGFDNEYPRHKVFAPPFAVADRLVTCGEWLEFMADGGYERPELWLSDGWATTTTARWRAPLYWDDEDGDWQLHTLGGRRPVDPAEPVGHISYYEADAFAQWTGLRLPGEVEWEIVAHDRPVSGNLLPADRLHPVRSDDPSAGSIQLFGDLWEWTSSSYHSYPGFRAAPGAVGEYNGKFMVNQMVLRGGACVTPGDHVRATYRNFFPPGARWIFSGVRLARDP